MARYVIELPTLAQVRDRVIVLEAKVDLLLAGQGGVIVPPTLGTVTLSGSLQIGTATSGTLLGTTALSTLASNIPGITFNSGARTYSGTPTGSAATIANGIVETLAGAVGSPRSSPVTVAAAATPAPAFTTQPSITGTPTVGQALSSLTYNDGTVTNGTVTARAYLLAGVSKALSYVLVIGDIGAALTFQNTATGVTSPPAVATSVAVTVVAAPVVAPAISTAPSFTGTAQDGQTLTGTRGTYTNSPTSYTNQWQRSANGTTWTNISGATALNYAVVTADVGNVVRLTEIAINSGGPSAVNASASSATVVAATPAAAAPTLTRTSAAGANPINWSGYYPGAIPDNPEIGRAGDIIQMRWTTNGGTTYSYAADHLFTSDDAQDSMDGTASFTWSAYQSAAATFANGTVVSVQEGVKRGSDATVWSNTLTETVTPVAEMTSQFATTNGVDKSQYLTVSGSPPLTIAGQGGFNNAPISARVDRSRAGKRQFQATIPATPGSRAWIGVDDGTTDFNSGFQRPGKTNSAGVCLSVRPGDWAIFAGGAQVQSGASGTLDPVAGDVFTCTFDTAAGTASFYLTRGATTYQFGTAQAVSLTTWKANLGTEGFEGEALTAKFTSGQARPLSTGYVPYDN